MVTYATKPQLDEVFDAGFGQGERVGENAQVGT